MQYVTFARAAREEIPHVNEKPVSPPTVWRWATKGLRGVRLRHLRVGRRCVTSREWLLEFFEAVANAEAPPHEAPQQVTQRMRTEKQRERDMERAERRLARSGI